MASKLHFTQATGTSTKKFTFSCWVKVNTESDQSGVPGFFSTSNGWADGTGIAFAFNSQQLRIYNGANGVGGSNMNRVQDRLFRDQNGWYHLVFQADTDESAIADRMKVYVNGTQQTITNVGGTDLNLPAQGASWQNLGVSGQTLQIGSASQSNQYFDGIIAHAHFCDGYSYPASTFGETDSTTGIWKPKTSPSVTYGTNGFFLKFENSGSMGTDSSGQSNNFTVTGTVTQTIDTPSNVFATLNPLARRITTNDPTYSNGNTSLQGQTVDGQNNNAIATLGDLAKGKYYFECKVGTVGSDFGVGISDTPDPSNGIPEGSYEVFYKYDGTKWTGSYTSYGATYTTGDIIGCAFDVTAGTVEFYKNGVSQGIAATDLATNLDHGYTPMGYTNQGLMHFNFGNGYFGTTAVSSAGTNAGIGTFEYDVPSGYKAVCTKNINAQEYS
jgi:hypothetical protein